MENLNNITQHLIIVICIILLGSCAASKSAYSPTGTWDYEVKNTPNGDASGKMTLTKEGEGYSGSFQTSEYGTIQMRDITMEGNALSSTFSIQGETFQVNGMFEGDSFTGKVVSNYGTFDMTANRVQQ